MSSMHNSKNWQEKMAHTKRKGLDKYVDKVPGELTGTPQDKLDSSYVERSCYYLTLYHINVWVCLITVLGEDI